MTLAELRAILRVVSVVEATNVSDVQINTMIEQAIQEIGVARRWRFLEAELNYTVAVGQQRYALPADFDYALALVDDDNDRKLTFLSPSTFFDMYGNDTGNTGTTAYLWTIWGNKDDAGAGSAGTATTRYLWLHPKPTAIDTARYRLYYQKRTPALGADGVSPIFHVGFHWMVVEWVKWKLYEREEFFDQAERSRQYYEKLLEDMERWYSNVANQHPFIWGEFDSIRIPDPFYTLPDLI